jgi:hypothetical protein
MMMLKGFLKKLLYRMGYSIERISRSKSEYPIIRPIDTKGVEILAEKEFQSSCNAIMKITKLDTPRLANLWMLCRLTDPAGAIAEIGTYRGGGALHLSNCCPERQMIICDPFSQESFEKLDPHLDRIFRHGQFVGHSPEQISKLFEGRNFLVIPGYFPNSVMDKPLPKLSFIHVDVDVYQATKESLMFLLTKQVLLAKSLIVLDDYKRRAYGVDKAVKEIVAEVDGTLVFPMFPGQALIVPNSWYES